jgi:acetamidase/formamidase
MTHRQCFGALLLFAMLVAPATAASARAGAAATHVLNATPTTVHRSFLDASLSPVLTIDSGDRVKLETATGNPRYFESLGVPKEKIPAELYAAFEGVEGNGRGDHTLNGPIAVRGAEPGDTIEVRVRSVAVRLPIAGQGFRPGGGVLPDEFPYRKDRALFIDLKRQTIEYAPGVHVPARPFWGVMALAPPASAGRLSSSPPYLHGGNLDNRHLGPGVSLFLPVQVPGGLLSIGDGHAAQGDGEVCGSAVEASLKGEIEVILHKGMKLSAPRAETPTHYMAMGLDKDLDEAARMATSQMLDLIVEKQGLTRENAYLLASAAMDLTITQAVDGTKGVHATLAKAIFRR